MAGLFCRALGSPPYTPHPRRGERAATRRSMDPAIDDGYLVRRAQDGYLDAYEVLVERYASRTYRVALRLLGNREDAEDVTQDALLAAWQALPGFRAEASFSTWLYRIVTTRALNEATRTAHTEGLDTIPEPPD